MIAVVPPYRAIVETMIDGAITLAADGVILYCNQRFISLIMDDQERVIGARMQKFVAPGEMDKFDALMKQAGNASAREHIYLLRSDGSLVPTYVAVHSLGAEGARSIVAVVTDLTELQRAQTMRDDLVAIVESAKDGIFGKDLNGVITSWNKGAERLYGYTAAEIVGQNVKILAPPDRSHEAAEIIARIRRGEDVIPYETQHITKAGQRMSLILAPSPIKDAAGTLIGVSTIALDITKLMRAEQGRDFNAAVISAIEQAVPDGILLFDPQGQIIFNNQRFLDIWAIPLKSIVGKALDPILAVVGTKVSDKTAFLAHIQELSTHTHKTSQNEILLKDGRTLDQYSAPVSLDNGAYLGRVWFFRDITERKRTEVSLRRVNRVLTTLSACNAALVRATNEHELLNKMCQVVVERGGFRMAWIGFAQQDSAKTVTPTAWAGDDAGYLHDVQFSWADVAHGRGPTGLAIRTGEVQASQNLAADDRMAPWKLEAKKQGFASTVALPLKDSAGVFGVLTIYAAEMDAFTAEELKFLRELAEDLAYGITALRDRLERDAAVQHWRDGLETTIGAIASTVEMRDPYTAGHQRRVAQLAVGIGQALGLSEHQVHGLYLAGVIHDVGKIQVPAEILNKPGKLSELEYQLIQAHAQAGYDIVKGVDFPWPIAQAVLQHHERLDGSGYPNGLKGDDIILEAKILAVADVIEAMMSHRPYRAALGLDKALAEIEQGKGRLYDPAAADACIRLFRKKKFAFS